MEHLRPADWKVLLFLYFDKFQKNKRKNPFPKYTVFTLSPEWLKYQQVTFRKTVLEEFYLFYFFSLFFLLGMLLTLIWQIHIECDTFGVTRLCHDIKTHFCTQTVKACIYMQRMKRIWMLLLLQRKCAIATMSEETMSQTKKKWVKTKNLWSKSWRKQRFSFREPFYKVDECNRFKLYLHGWREKER